MTYSETFSSKVRRFEKVLARVMEISMTCFLSLVVVLQGSCIIDGKHNHENSTSLLFLAVESIHNEGTECLRIQVQEVSWRKFK